MVGKNLSDETLQALIDSDPGSFAIYRMDDEKTAIPLYVSTDRPAYLGHITTDYEAEGKNAFSFVMEEDRPFLFDALHRLFTDGHDVEITYRIHHETLQTAWVHAIFRLLGERDGKPIVFVSFLSSSGENNLFSQLLESIKTILYVVDAKNYRILYANRAALESRAHTGAYANEFCYAYIRGEQAVCTDCLFKNLQIGQVVRNEVYRPLTKRWELVSCQRLNWCGYDAIIQTIEDITDYKNVQVQLECQRNDLEATIASIPVGISIFRKVGNEITRTSMNDDVARIKGVSRTELAKDTFDEVFKRVWPTDKERVIQDTRDVFEKGHTVCIYRTKNEKTGLYIWLRREGNAFTKEDGTQTAYFCYTDITSQMETEEALRQSQDRYLNAVQGGDIAVWEYDPQAKTVSSPENSLTLIGLPNYLKNVPESLLPYFEEESHAALLRQIALLDEGKDSPSAELWIKNVGGHRRCYQVTYTLLKDPTGKPLKAFGVTQDITLQKEIESEYSRSAQDFLSLNPAALCSFRVNLTKNVCYGGQGSSSYIKKILISPTADGLFQNLLGLIDESDERERVRTTLNRSALLLSFAQGKKNLSLTYRRSMENGDRHWVTSYLSLIKNPTSQDIEVLLYSLDTDKEVKEQQIDRRLSLENYEFVALINVKNGKISFHNIDASAWPTTPHCTDDFEADVKAAFQQVASPENAQRIEEALLLSHVIKELDEKGKYSYYFTIEKGQGQGQVKLLNFIYLNERKEDILFSRSDITSAVAEEKAASARYQSALEEAKRANQMKTDFLSNVSHDMRTPLNGVIGYTDLALDAPDMETMKQYLLKIRQSGVLLMSLINDTLDLSKIENGQIVIQKTPILFEDFLSRITTVITPSVETKGLHFILVKNGPLPKEVNVDVIKLTEIINNLLSNAVKYTPEGGHISLSVETLGEDEKTYREQIVVSDDGIGMSTAFVQGKAFEPFSQERTKQNAGVGGSGLGLSIVKRLVDLFGGTITLASTLGKGTTFTVVLPLDKSNEITPSASQNSVPSIHHLGARLLLVEDNWMNVEIAKALLTKNGYLIDTATNGEEGVTKFSASIEGYYAGILMDIRMPIMNGFAASKAIRALPRKDATTVPIIAMTADAYEDDIKRCLDAGMNSHVAKPIDKNTLLSELNRLL